MVPCLSCWLRFSSYCMGCRYWATGIGAGQMSMR